MPSYPIIVAFCLLISGRYLDVTGLSKEQSQFLDEKNQPQTDNVTMEQKAEPQAAASFPCSAEDLSRQWEAKGVGLCTQVSGPLL